MNDFRFFFRDGEDSPLVAALQLDVLAAGTPLSVSAADEMFNVFYYGRGESRDLALHMYLESGKRIWKTFRQVLEWHFGDLARVGSLLDFAAGYGRVSRFLLDDLPAERVWISEIDAGAVRFQEATFGVHGLLSAADPEAFSPGRKFSSILVSSLFTHLPEPRFRAWLAKLLGLVEDGGLLAFSIHDTQLLPDAGEAPFVFRELSESGSLSTAEYGSAWATEGFVRASLAALAPEGGLSVERIPRGLASYQDLYVVSRGAPRRPATVPDLAPLRGGADGFVESCHLSAGRTLAVGGWVTDRSTRQPVQEIQVYLDGRLAVRSATLSDRPEVADVFPGDAAGGQGWHLEIPLPRRFDTAALRLVAVGADGFSSCLLETTVLALVARVALFRGLSLEREILDLREAQGRLAQDHEERLAELATTRVEKEEWSRRAGALETRIAAMRASRFWQLRDRWFALKRRLRLTTEA